MRVFFQLATPGTCVLQISYPSHPAHTPLLMHSHKDDDSHSMDHSSLYN
ncbi:hypothetical protein M5D96_001233 [Drosophila gunungcola]|uniref:Uncharacterized protein n=1 Tax=Drosophila gunungcola TaxID=103775 RepID=A0A9P9YXS8_9MUSC|nr:hypothetical protein M5D96_001233 [Drosophila gunungcola]